jgi:hypothetical protein
LGAAVVKAALRVWFKDNTLASESSVSVVDLVKAKVSGDLEKRNVQRLLEDLEVPVASRLRAVRTTEFGAMPENEWQASVLAAGISFERANLTAQELLTRDLDPLSLERLIRADSAHATRYLSADGSALYDRLINEGCAYAVEIADKLPHFRVGAVAELLRRDREIREIVNEILDRIPKKASGEAQEASIVTAYLRHLARRLDRLEIFGLDFDSSWYPLSIAYVNLEITTVKYIEDILEANPRIVVVGRPGAGKTTVLQWLAVRAARSDFTGKLASINDYIPFYIRLREYVGNRLPTPEEFIANIAPMWAGEMPAGWIRSRLRTGTALVLIDGVDELPLPQREKVSGWLEELTQLFPDARYIVTARPTAVPEDWLIDHGFTQISLQAMSPLLIEKFVSHWYEAARHRTSDNEERELLNRYETSLQASISDDPHLRDLADTPLLAGLLCSLNRHLRSHLPRRRSEIYERAIVMFDQRDRIRGINTEGLPLEATAKTHLLADLAFWMVRNGESEVEMDAARNIIRRSLTSLPPADHKPEIVFRLLLERSGLLRVPAVGKVDFIHRTFQEFLAARAAVHEDAIGELLRNAEEVQWREVVLLAAGQANRPQATRLLQGLLGRTSHGSRSRRRLFAISCLQEIRSVDEQLRQSVLDRLPSLLPPTSMEQAKELSGAGTRLIRPLAQEWTRSKNHAPETIRAASLVASPAALDLIEIIIPQASINNDNSLFSEIIRASQYFDTDDYERRMKQALLIRIRNNITKSLAELAEAEIAAAAQSAAEILAPGLGKNLPDEIKDALDIRDTRQRSDQYRNPSSEARLIVAIAKLTWPMFNYQRMRIPYPPSSSIARQVQITLGVQYNRLPRGTERIAEVMATEIIRQAALRESRTQDPESANK